MDETTFQSGAAIDFRSDEKREKDVSLNELVAAVNPVIWREKKDNEFRSFPNRFQDGSGSCVAQTTSALAQIQLYNKEKSLEDFSATSIYQPRSNKPQGGMIGVEAFDIWMNHGISLESLVPSQQMSDAQMDALEIEQYEKDVAAIFKIKNHAGLPNGNFDMVASTIQTTRKGVMTWFYFTAQEWSQLVPTIQDQSLFYADNRALRHSVAAIDFGLRNGVQVIKIKDSAPFGGLSERFITREFFEKRNWFNRYATTFNFEEEGLPPTPNYHYTFTKPLVFIPLDAQGNISDTSLNAAQHDDVVALQTILQNEGFFPNNHTATGYYGALTSKGVLQFQKKYAVAPTAELDALKGRRVGSKTLLALNALYG